MNFWVELQSCNFCKQNHDETADTVTTSTSPNFCKQNHDETADVPSHQSSLHVHYNEPTDHNKFRLTSTTNATETKITKEKK